MWMWLWIIILAVAFGMVLVAVRKKNVPKEETTLEKRVRDPLEGALPGGPRWASTDEISPSTRDAYEKGEMSNDQMVEMLRACGWNAQLDKDGKLIVPKVNKDNDE